MLSGRDPSALLAALAPIKPRPSSSVRPSRRERSGPDALAEAARALGLDAVVADSVADAISGAAPRCPRAGSLLVTGSLYVVTEARTLLLGTTATP